MLCAPVVVGLAEQVAVPPGTGAAVHPVMGEPLSVKLTVPPPGAGLAEAV
jgi:hypothetical protein